MSKLGSVIGRKPSVPAIGDKSVVADKIAAPEILAIPPEPQKPQKAIVELDNELFLPIPRQLGEENESVRNLLIDVEHKINERDAIRRAVGKPVEPVSKTLRAREEAKSELGAAEKKVAMLESECARLREALTETQQKFAAPESIKAEQTTELADRRAQVNSAR